MAVIFDDPAVIFDSLTITFDGMDLSGVGPPPLGSTAILIAQAPPRIAAISLRAAFLDFRAYVWVPIVAQGSPAQRARQAREDEELRLLVP